MVLTARSFLFKGYASKMATTLDNFYTEVLRELKVVEPNGTGSSEDRQRVVDAYPRIWEMLWNRELVTWNVTDSIPDWAVIPLTKIAANIVATRFAVSGERLLFLKADGEIDARVPSWAERQLRKQTSSEYIPSTLSNDFF